MAIMLLSQTRTDQFIRSARPSKREDGEGKAVHLYRMCVI